MHEPNACMNKQYCDNKILKTVLITMMLRKKLHYIAEEYTGINAKKKIKEKPQCPIRDEHTITCTYIIFT